MTKLLITNIKGLVQIDESDRKWRAGKELADLSILENAFLLIEDGKIANYGSMAAVPQSEGI